MKLITLIILAALLFLGLYLGISASKLRRAAVNRDNSWPEVLDLIISSLQSGASISESLANLGKIAPAAVRDNFARFTKNLAQGEKFEDCLSKLKADFADPISDQLFETLYFAARFGSKNTIKVLRELSEYVAADLSTRSEIQIRFGWIKNSANLAALAPWVLFLILRTQENAKAAYLQPTGQLILVLGVVATLIAYLWMNKIANLPKAKRLFTKQILAK
jgi:tight adherence protein B